MSDIGELEEINIKPQREGCEKRIHWGLQSIKRINVSQAEARARGRKNAFSAGRQRKPRPVTLATVPLSKPE